MTNAEYVMSILTDSDLAELFATNSIRWNFTSPNNKRIHKAFENWREDTYRPNRNFTKEGEPDPSVWQWGRIHNHKTDKWECIGREESLVFQHWLFLQYNKKHWDQI
jgi:hypothetical protein